MGKHSVWLERLHLDYIQPLGDIFINILKLIAVPLVLFSIIGGVASLGDVKKLGRLGAKTLGLYLLTTFFAVTLGLVLVNLFQPGAGAQRIAENLNRIRYELWRDANGIEVLDDLQLSPPQRMRRWCATSAASKKA